MTKNIKIDGSSVGVYIAKEASIGVLPVTPVWQQLEPSEVGDMGGETTQTARTIIRPDRQASRGAITDLTASASFTQELSQNNATDLMQGFVFALAHEPFTTKPLNTTGTTVSVTSTGYSLTTASYATDKVLENSIVKASGFKSSANNGVKVVTAVGSGDISVSGLVTEAVGDGVVQVVGYKATDASIDVDGYITLEFTGAETLGLEVGQWIFVGGDTNKFTTNGAFYSRVSDIAEGVLTLDYSTGASELVAETATTVDIYFGTAVHNEDSVENIKRTTYTIEQQLGYVDQERTTPQAQYIKGCVPNELTVNIEQGALSSIEYSFMGCTVDVKSGTLASGTRKDAWDEKGYNNANEVYLATLSTVSSDPTKTIPVPFFNYMSSCNLAINNNGSEMKAVGVLGNREISSGKFNVEVTPSVYFTDVASIKAMWENIDCGMQLILSRNNEGIIFDVPMMGLGSSIPSISEDEPITMDLTATGAKSKYGYTFNFTTFAYLPTIAMASETGMNA